MKSFKEIRQSVNEEDRSGPTGTLDRTQRTLDISLDLILVRLQTDLEKFTQTEITCPKSWWTQR